MAGLVSHILLAITALVHQAFQEMNVRSPFHLITVRLLRVKTAEVASRHLTNKTLTDVTVNKVFPAGIVKVVSACLKRITTLHVSLILTLQPGIEIRQEAQSQHSKDITTCTLIHLGYPLGITTISMTKTLPLKIKTIA